VIIGRLLISRFLAYVYRVYCSHINLHPKANQEALTAISEESYQLHQEAATLNMEMDTLWLELRASCKTDKECDKKLGATEKGQRATYLKFYLRGLANKRTALMEESKNNRGSTW
jgi:hypothetical protein